MLGFCAVAPVIDVFAKLASAHHAVGQITAGRFVVQGAILLPIALWLGLPLVMSRRDAALIFLRGLLTLAATFSFVWAVSIMPLADALAITYIEPFILLLFGWALFGEEVGPRRLIASVTGFVGVLIVVRPGLLAFGSAALLPLAAGFFFACYMLVTRALRHYDPVALQASTAIAALIVAWPLLVIFDGTGGPLDPSWPTGWDWLWLAGVGVAATISHQGLTLALRHAPSATVAPLGYLELVFSTLAGLLVFGDFPAPVVWLGIAIIVASGLYIIHRERVNRRKPAIPADPNAV
ncbi:EamA family transporter [Celeribacter ethanolicus]|uniref:EamA family transporter n=2 Tax=Celeribacter ethanolicus TaxID=1758178 RepID=A0A291GHT5_9RHOB|nr:EamA family transporter [Celeribacter ethanolicus]TNE70105.1 MAG: DMT family transporter [Paracoccaceae bacterium]